MKKFTILVMFLHLLLAFMALGLILASCNTPSNGRDNKNKEGETTFTIRFNVNGGSGTAPDTQVIDAGSRITLPSGDGLSKNGYTFGGWNIKTDGMGYNYAAGSSFTPDGDITLYAKWNRVSAGSFTVTFNSNGGNNVTTQTVNSGGTVTRPADPAKSGYTFGNWYSNASLTEVYNFSTPVTGNITLYAKWNVVSAGSFTVIFNSNGGSSVTTQTVNSGGTATRPAVPAKNGYTFDGWYSDENMTVVYDFSTSVMDNIILYARWVAKEVSPDRIEYYWVDQHGNLVTTSGGATSIASGATLAITAQGTGFVVQQWRLNGKSTGQSGNTYTFSSTTAGNHTVGLFVEKDGNLYSTNITITVQ